MKFYCCTFLLCLFSLADAFAGEFHSSVLQKGTDGQWTYEKVINADGNNQEALYKKMKMWIVSHVKTADNNIMYDDKGFETIVTTPTIKLENIKNKHLHDQVANFKLTIYFKDNKMKVVANTFYYYGLDMTGNERKGPFEGLQIKRIIPAPYDELEEKFDASFTSFVEELERAAKDTKKSDW